MRPDRSYLADFKAGHVIGDGQLGRRKMGVSLHCRRATEPLEEVPLLQLNFPSLHPFESRSLPAILLEFAALSLMATHNIPNATLVQLEPEPQSANDGRARWIIAPRPDKVGTASHINNVELGRHGRYRTNVWTYAGINSFGRDRDAELALHPTVKPIALVADAILDCSKRRGIVLDAFAGSGTTLVAAEKAGRWGYGIELDPHYCDVIIKRLTDRTGLEAIHTETDKTFADRESEQSE